LWSPGRVEPGTYSPVLHAVDQAGNAADVDLAPVEVRRDTQPPTVAASLAGRRLYWRGKDDASPWLSLRVVVRRPLGVRKLVLDRVPFRGSALLPLPRGSHITVFAADSSGNTTLVPLT
jgi:hypothetical protein